MNSNGPLVSGDALNSLWMYINHNRHKGLKLHPSLTFMFNKKWRYGVGAFTTVNLVANTVVAQIPKSCILSVRTVSNPMLRDLLQSRNLGGLVGLTIAYIYESCQGKSSPFYDYISCFTYPDIPKLWKSDEKALLKGTDLEASDALSTVP